jgi:hypothetical protein
MAARFENVTGLPGAQAVLAMRFYGALAPTPRDLATAHVGPEPLRPWDEARRSGWKVIYAIGRRAE